MAIPDYNSIGYLEEARSRVTEAFKEKDVFDRYLQLMIAELGNISESVREVLQLRGLDEAKGAQLDVIGRIVGQDRVLLQADLYEWFGMQGALNAQSFGDANDPAIGGLFYDFGTPFGGNVELDDETYRKFIKAKIYKNTTSSTPEEFIEVVNVIFNTPKTYIYEDDAKFFVYFGRTLTNFERVLLNYISYSEGYPSRLLPKTVGVGIGYGEFQANKFFGFQGTPGALGFGELNGDYGYGLGYGLNYGQSNYTQDYDGKGGIFATIY